MNTHERNSKVHARLTRMLAHAGVSPYTREEWATIVRPLAAEHGNATKAIARAARDEILASRTPVLEDIAHEPIDDATRIFAQVA